MGVAGLAHSSHEHDDEHGEHGHSHTQFSVDIYNTERAFKAVKWGTAGLLATALLQFGIQYFVGSAGLLADALHNMGDVFTTVALWLAFSLSRKEANRRYNYGYSRAEDIAGVIIIIVILISAFLGAWESYLHFVNNERPTNIFWGLIGALIGVVGNEAVAQYKINIGKEINSVPLIADGQHSRLDGLTSLAAFIGLLGVQFGFPQADPIAGIIITIVIAFVVVEATKNVLGRLMDAIDPKLSTELEQTARSVEGIRDVKDFRARWFGRNIQVVMAVEVDPRLNLVQAHNLAEEVRHALLHKNGVSLVDVHVDPYDPTGEAGYHEMTEHHVTGQDEPANDHHDHDHAGHDHAEHDNANHHDHAEPARQAQAPGSAPQPHKH